MITPARVTITVTAYPTDPQFTIQIGSSAASLTEPEARQLRHEIDVWLTTRQRARALRYWRALVHRSAGWISPRRHS